MKTRTASTGALIQNALYDKGYRRGNTYTPRGSLQTVKDFTAYIKGGHLLLLMEMADGSCELLTPLCTENDLAATMAAIP